MTSWVKGQQIIKSQTAPKGVSTEPSPPQWATYTTHAYVREGIAPTYRLTKNGNFLGLSDVQIFY